MTIYYNLTFQLLAAEMIVFCLLVAPLPNGVRRKFFTFFSGSRIVAKIAYSLKIAFIFVGILFVDAVQRMLRTTSEVDLAKTNHPGDARVESALAARKFYAQRNMYLTGFCLFLSLVLTRTLHLLFELINTQAEYSKLKKQVESTKTGGKAQDSSKEIADLKKKVAELEAKDRDFGWWCCFEMDEL
ncbi:B-cell receptor-associated 31-like protein, partial [Amanita muscaria]